MKPASVALLFLYIFVYCVGNEYFVEAAVVNGSEQLDGAGNGNSTSLDVLPSTLLPRLVTDVNDGGHRFAEVFQDNSNGTINCNLIGDKTIIQQILRLIPAGLVTSVTTAQMDEVVDKCQDKEPMMQGSSLLSTLGDDLQSLLIFPGTKWCGAGNVAKNYDDLGSASATDTCCRDHDHSEDSIPAFGTEHGITNYMIYTMTNCPDDNKLFYCLQNVSSPTSVAVGTIYFDILRTHCFEYGYPTICTDYNYFRILLLQDPCEERKPDTTKPMQWQVVGPMPFLETFIKNGGNVTNSPLSRLSNR
ncbi:uncharacterized protein LOC125942597 [Dermacentor silvarum]|uniref:uncharacterized protein LOC125942597 n=1 Tax=Dermacentor silvarum TaxID=543639 RepID=UPI002101CDE8|nr:uncharacterized protein LOC125942597 [Dermacentor silvarum]